MRLLFDENLSYRLVDRLADLFPGSAQVVRAGMESASDADVWAFARAGGYTVVTKDDDFRQRVMVFGPPPKVVWVRLLNCPTAQVESLLRWHAAKIAALESDPVASLLILP